MQCFKVKSSQYSMNTQIETNPLIDRLPPHLKQFIKPQ
ncbi:MAG: hypothetical protein ACI9SD_000413, partial [Pseudohongiellaceae bacterium]